MCVLYPTRACARACLEEQPPLPNSPQSKETRGKEKPPKPAEKDARQIRDENGGPANYIDQLASEAGGEEEERMDGPHLLSVLRPHTLMYTSDDFRNQTTGCD